jgi:dCTP deaminase
MILSQPDLRDAVERGEIVFDPPIETSQWGEASVDLRLGFSFTKLVAHEGLKVSVARGLREVGDAGLWKTKELRERDEMGKLEAYPVEPREFVLGLTHESVRIPRGLIARVEGRSTYARMGLSMHQTAPWIQPGWTGRIVLEIMNNGPLTIELTPLLDRPCQLTFFRLTRELPENLAYGGRNGDRYQGQTHPLKHER